MLLKRKTFYFYSRLHCVLRLISSKPKAIAAFILRKSSTLHWTFAKHFREKNRQSKCVPTLNLFALSYERKFN